MKKSLVLVMLVVALVAVSVFGFAACNKKADVVKVIDIKITTEEYAFCVNKNDTDNTHASDFLNNPNFICLTP